MTSHQLPYNLDALAQYVQRTPEAKPKPPPCETWCSMPAIAGGFSRGGAGYCTCQEACAWESCPMDEAAYVPPPVPKFREEDA